MSHTTRTRYVLDASVALKWYLEDEPYTEYADVLFSSFAEGRIDLVVPQHIHYEVANALCTAANRGRFPEVRARTTLVEFLDLDVPVVSGNGLIIRAWDLALRYGCAHYDALYLAVAEITEASLIHADRRLRNTLAGRFPRELWIENFRSNEPDPA